MSHLYITSPKHCAKQGFNLNKSYKKLFYAFSTFIFSILSFVLLIWIILHPSKPQFYLKEADLYQLNLSSPYYLLNSSIQATLSSKNPNSKVGVYYDSVRAYVSYKGQRITNDLSLPPFYQGNGDTNILSASLYGYDLPVTPTFGYEVSRDQSDGELQLVLKLDGRLRWKVGTWVSGYYRFDVYCVAVVGLKASMDTSGPFRSLQGAQCSTTV
ncbi:hypothetical protein QJS10_CPA10g00680 [Acorus calamus]|uniref:Late embryogenesis abundant protein LEA-2 subgroup domain-containing protein n=1 Tax=Acorus calamus TaxID=4465 RepID=A0AAV9DWQ0_ACOCL|nr:hypothetical protein QJS10_CPA10g00680 [Acorus calamus]